MRESKDSTWQSILKLKVPGSVKYFIWRACYDILPTRMNLMQRKVVDSNICRIYERETKSIIHAL